MGTADTKQANVTPYLRSAILRYVQPFDSEVSFQFDPKVNVFIGPNGVGKSRALGAIAGVRQTSFSSDPDEPEREVERFMEPDDDPDGITAVYVGPTRIPLDPDTVLQDLQQIDIQEKLVRIFNIVRISALIVSSAFLVFLTIAMIGGMFPDLSLGAWVTLVIIVWVANLVYITASWARRHPLRFAPSNRLLSSMLTDRSVMSSVFMFQMVQVANRRLLTAGNYSERSRRSASALEAAELALSCAKSIAPEAFPAAASLYTGAVMASDDSTQTRWLGWWRTRFFVNHLSSVDTRYSPNPLHIADLSSGTQGPLLIAWYLALKLVYSHRFQHGWEERPAILFIDEIENHLHPVWQRRIIPAFLEHFPNLQIFATTHSPFTVAGLKAGQVHKLFQGDDGGTTVETIEYDLVGWTSDEILHTYLDVCDPTDLETAQAVEVLRWLDQLDDLTYEESAESWRIAVLDDLNGLIKQDEATTEEGIVARWLSGQEAPVQLSPPLNGEAEAWKKATVTKLRSVAGVDILSGGPAARQRLIRDQQIADGTFRVS